MINIKDGRTGNILEVDSKFRAQVKSSTQTEILTASKNGGAYAALTGLITLTSANESGLLYFSTNESDNIIIESVAFDFGEAIGATSTDIIVRQYALVTGGTLLSNAVSAPPVNINASSSNTLNAVVYKGVEGDTVVGTEIATRVYQVKSNVFESGGSIFPKGSNFVASVQPPAGNTSMKVNVRFILYLEGEA